MTDLHERWPHRWLTSKAETRHSPVEGLGVFAKETIHKAEEVGVLGGVIVPTSDIKGYRSMMGRVGIQIADNFFIVPTGREDLKKRGVYNHSCDPNIGFSNSVTFVAMRDILADEELLFDYAFCETYANEAFECACGSANCRNHIKSDDWKRAEIMEKYKNYYSPYLRDKVTTLSGSR